MYFSVNNLSFFFSVSRFRRPGAPVRCICRAELRSDDPRMDRGRAGIGRNNAHEGLRSPRALQAQNR
jgi:hypothetical protein